MDRQAAVTELRHSDQPEETIQAYVRHAEERSGTDYWASVTSEDLLDDFGLFVAALSLPEVSE